MLIQDFFERKIDRTINGVVKADDKEPGVVWQELDEFVVTKELNGHFDQVIEVLVEASERGSSFASSHNGIWISGFFGCGKSHFLKVLSYLLENHEHAFQGNRQHAVDFFEKKFENAMLFGDLRKAVAAPTETILFNIDTKADRSKGLDALLHVFLRVFNEHRGYSPDYPYIAHLEQQLEEEGKLEEFHAAFERHAGDPWLQKRHQWLLRKKHVVSALCETLGQPPEAMNDLLGGAKERFPLTIENFANWVKAYLDRQGPDHRIMFLIDEVGQFIGTDTQLMLNLQTITEQLGTVCEGRAWVMVTSQEDFDDVLGDMNKTKRNDFSKIQGRFSTKLSLSSANVDEVLKTRLLEKKEDEAVRATLHGAYAGKQDILKNHLSFVEAGRTYPSYTGPEDFAECYPFPSYQFSLLQSVFDSIRKVGATGQNLSRGERSLLEAFQSAVRGVGNQTAGVLVPFYTFYDSVKTFLDTAVLATISNARNNPSLEAYDINVLRVLFLIRYIDEVPGSVDNLVTLCVDGIDIDKLALRKRVEASLERLESETLIARNGEIYFFLTNEEREIGREIKGTPVPSGAVERMASKMLFDEVLNETRKHTYSKTRRTFNFSRKSDGYAIGQFHEGGLQVSLITPLGDRYAELSNDAACILETSSDAGLVLARLPDVDKLHQELLTYVQTELYVKTKNQGALAESTKNILKARTDENRGRKKRILATLSNGLADATWYASGQVLQIKRSAPITALGEALEYAIGNAYSKMAYVSHPAKNPLAEIQSCLRANDVEQTSLGLATPKANAAALDDLREYLRLSAIRHEKVVLHDLIHKRYGERPYGWHPQEVVLLVARLAVARELTLTYEGAPLAPPDAYEKLTSASKQNKVVLARREGASEALLKQVGSQAKALFLKTAPADEGGQFTFVQAELGTWQQDLESWKPLAATGDFPGLSEIDSALDTLRPLLLFTEAQSNKALERFVGANPDLLDLKDDLEDLREFYTSQRPTWKTLNDTLSELETNQYELKTHETGAAALQRLKEIRQAPHPYGLLHEVAGLVHKASAANAELVLAVRQPTLDVLEGHRQDVTADLDQVGASEALRSRVLAMFARLQSDIEAMKSIAHIEQAGTRIQEVFDQAITAIEESQKATPVPSPAPGPPPSPTPGGGSAEAPGTAPQGSDTPPSGVPGTPEAPPPVAPPAPKLKQRSMVVPRELVQTTFIETPTEMEAFLDALRSVMEEALAAGKRIQVK